MLARLKREPVVLLSLLSVLVSSLLLNWDAFAGWLTAQHVPGWVVVVLFQMLTAWVQRSQVSPTNKG